MGSPPVSQIPIINFNDENLKPGTDTWFSASQLVRSALEGNGCVFVSCNKVPMELCNSVFALIKELFDLPMDTKKQKVTDKPNQGYFGGHPSALLYEGIGINLDAPLIEEAIQRFANIMWPSGYDHFCLEVNLRTGEGVPVDPSPSLFLILAGDAFKVWSNGRKQLVNIKLR